MHIWNIWVVSACPHHCMKCASSTSSIRFDFPVSGLCEIHSIPNVMASRRNVFRREKFKIFLDLLSVSSASSISFFILTHRVLLYRIPCWNLVQLLNFSCEPSRVKCQRTCHVLWRGTVKKESKIEKKLPKMIKFVLCRILRRSTNGYLTCIFEIRLHDFSRCSKMLHVRHVHFQISVSNIRGVFKYPRIFALCGHTIRRHEVSREARRLSITR